MSRKSSASLRRAIAEAPARAAEPILQQTKSETTTVLLLVHYATSRLAFEAVARHTRRFGPELAPRGA